MTLAFADENDLCLWRLDEMIDGDDIDAVDDGDASLEVRRTNVLLIIVLGKIICEVVLLRMLKIITPRFIQQDCRLKTNTD